MYLCNMDRISDSLARVFYSFVNSLERFVPYRCKALVDYYRNVSFPNNAKSWSRPVMDRAAVVSAFYLFQLGSESGPPRSSFA